jgi:hypothetical protein
VPASSDGGIALTEDRASGRGCVTIKVQFSSPTRGPDNGLRASRATAWHVLHTRHNISRREDSSIVETGLNAISEMETITLDNGSLAFQAASPSGDGDHQIPFKPPCRFIVTLAGRRVRQSLYLYNVETGASGPPGTAGRSCVPHLPRKIS